jgi:hypothetical protein
LKLLSTALLFVVFLYGAGTLWKAQTGAPVGNSTETILKNDLEKLEKNLASEIIKDESWKKINDYAIPPAQLVNSKNAKHLFKLSNNSIDNLAICLRKDFCGMEKRNEHDAYFDDKKTPGHILLGRNLSIMLSVLKLYPELENEINWEMIRELTENNNENIQVLAIELLNNFKSNEINIFSVIDNFKGNAKGRALADLKTKDSSSERQMLINSLEKSFASDDPNTVISVVEQLKKMRLSKDEMEKVSRNLCHYKEKGIDDPNWKMIKYDMGLVRVDLDKVCSN